MKNYYSIAIPKPCHEDWNQMSPQDKGRFCNSCSKTVIDFTKMETFEIQDFINEHRGNAICGHFKQTQLDSINLHIPTQVLAQQQSFHKLFLLVLLIVMGTTLMNCTNKNGNKQKIDSVEIVDTIQENLTYVNIGEPQFGESDSIQKITCKSKDVKNSKKGKEIIEEPIIMGDMVEIVGLIIPNEILNSPIPFVNVDNPPEFPNTQQNLSIEEKRDYFKKRINDFVLGNFEYNSTVNLDLIGKQKIFIQFDIDKNGNIIDIKVRAPHIKLEEEARRVIKLLPQFIPAKQANKPVGIVYNLPIIFQVEE